MERLTERFDGQVVRKGCHGPCSTCPGAECADIYPMIDRLAAYEDTGLEPEEISGLCSMYERSKMADPLRLEEYKTLGTIDHLRELAQAENDGRLVVLQCKPGQKIWAESPIKGMAYCFDAPDIAWIIENAELFGKEIFLSCEEAEAAMNKREEARGNGAVGFQ